MAEKRLKDRIKEVKKEIKENRKRFDEVATQAPKFTGWGYETSYTDLKLLKTIQKNIDTLTVELRNLETKYRRGRTHIEEDGDE